MSEKALKQEFFSIDEAKRAKVVRQDRVPIDPGSGYLLIGDLSLELINVSAFGCAALLNSSQSSDFEKIYQQESSLKATILYHNMQLQEVVLKAVRSESPITSVIEEKIFGFEVLGEPIKLEVFSALDSALNIIKKQDDHVSMTKELPGEFKQFVYELKDFLERLKSHIDKIEEEMPVDNWKMNQDYRSTIADTISLYLNRLMPEKYKKIYQLIGNLNPKEIETATAFARKNLGHLVYGAPFASRAYYKPRGYAGDYEMMNHLYRDEIVGRSFYDQCMHKYFVDEPAALAVKNRGQYLYQKIKNLFENSKNKTLKILSVASGPAVEQQLFLKNEHDYLSQGAEFTCVDQDEESLKHAQRQIHSINRLVKSNFKFNFKNIAIKNILMKGCPDQGYDLIYSAGLFDYFTDAVSHAAAKKMLESLKEGGTLIIGNFSKDNPTTPLMELILDWHLIYRSREDLMRIFNGLGSSVTVESEPLGINLFVIIKK